MKIQAGDTVKHKPSGETWGVLGVNHDSDRLCVGGWPPTIAKISDCELIEKGDGKITDEELKHRTKEFGHSWE